jgi:hypothetical protein
VLKHRIGRDLEDKVELLSLEISTLYGQRGFRRALSTSPVVFSAMVRAQASSPADAKLIAACRQIVALRYHGNAVRDTQDEMTEISEKTERLLGQIEGSGDPKTLEGVRALAAAAMSLAPLSEGQPVVRDDFEWLMLCVVEFFTRGAGRAV